jgi:hypothetical protein
MNNQYRSIIVVVRLKHHSALVIIIVGVNIRGLSYTKLKQNKKLGLLEKFGLRRIDQEKNKRQEKKKSNERERVATAYPRSAVMSFGYICVKRERMSLSRVFFLFLSFSFLPSSYPFLRSIKRFGSMVAFFFLFSSFDSAAAVAIVDIYTLMTISGIVYVCV